MEHLNHIKTQKITAHLPVDLLDSMQNYTGAGITETLRIALEEMKRRKAYQDLRNLRGKIKFSLDLEELRKDRDEP